MIDRSQQIMEQSRRKTLNALVQVRPGTRHAAIRAALSGPLQQQIEDLAEDDHILMRTDLWVWILGTGLISCAAFTALLVAAADRDLSWQALVGLVLVAISLGGLAFSLLDRTSVVDRMVDWLMRNNRARRQTSKPDTEVNVDRFEAWLKSLPEISTAGRKDLHALGAAVPLHLDQVRWWIEQEARRHVAAGCVRL
jgi:hypothetical protein